MMQADHWTVKMNSLLQKINGYGFLLRFVTPILLMVLAWNAKEIVSDVKYIRQNVIYKDQYVEDKNMLIGVLNKMDDRLRIIETNGRRK